jgi:hypothetical protein
MKIIFCLLAVCVAAAAIAQDLSGRSIRYRNGTTLKFDAQSSIKDEDSVWTLSNAQLGKLAVLQFGTAANGNNFKVTNTFATAFSSAPVITVAAGTNDLPHLITVTTSNVIFGAAQTNASIRWIAIGAP